MQQQLVKEFRASFKRDLSKKKWSFWLGMVGLFVVSAVITYAWGTFRQITVTPNLTQTSPSPSPVDERYAHLFNQGNNYAVLLLGYGGGAHEGGKLTDSMMIMYLEPKLQRLSLISLPRDVWVGLPVEAETESHWKINAAYAIGADDRRYTHKPLQYTGEAGGGQLAKFAVEKVTGIPINAFVALDFRGFMKTIDTLGGVNVKVERTFDDPQYPIEGEENNTCGLAETDIQAMTATMSATDLEKAFPCRYEQLHFDIGKQLLSGETALKYVRSRHSSVDGGDFNRAARQRNLILAVKERVLALNFLPKALPFANSLAGSLTTDLTLDQMEKFLSFKDEVSEYSIQGLALTDKNIFVQDRSPDGQFILRPQAGVDQWSSVHDWLKAELATASGQPKTP